MSNERKFTIEYLDKYIRQGEPDKIEKAYIWQTAIALLLVDGNRYSHIRATEEWKGQPRLYAIDLAKEYFQENDGVRNRDKSHFDICFE